MSLTSQFIAGPLKFAQEHAIAPPHGVEMEIDIKNVSGKGTQKIKTDYKGDEAKKLSVAGHATSLDEVGYSRVMRSKKVAYIEMYSDMRDGAANNREGKAVVRMHSKFEQFGQAEPVYFLPWDDRGYEDGHVRKTHPAEQNLSGWKLSDCIDEAPGSGQR